MKIICSKCKKEARILVFDRGYYPYNFKVKVACHGEEETVIVDNISLSIGEDIMAFRKGEGQ